MKWIISWWCGQLLDMVQTSTSLTGTLPHSLAKPSLDGSSRLVDEVGQCADMLCLGEDGWVVL